ncbi:MAG TPA: sigma-70 family RNA polymerase sigma factor [bacterium]|nr:sigma-70 family RNA polymerase sigma factor [bacterium]HPN33524.1 sigma-70 family RNA polymerase sigma factor [bacterium]
MIQAYQEGSPYAFNRLLQRYQTPLFTYLLRWVRDRAIAEDLFQETFLRVIRALPDYREQDKFGSWLFGIAHRLCLDHFRRQKACRGIWQPASADEGQQGVPEPADRTPSPQEIAERHEFSLLLDLALEKMPAPAREVFLLRQHSDLPFREIAALLERPLNTVLGQMRQAVEHLRQTMEKHYA